MVLVRIGVVIIIVCCWVFSCRLLVICIFSGLSMY